jgi:hypothetical protein
MTTVRNDKPASLLRIAAGIGLILSVAACASTGPSTTSSVKPNTKPASEQAFASPDDAVDALVTASRADDKAKIIKIMGPLSERLLHSGDKVADQKSRERFLAAYDKAHQIEPEGDNKMVLVVGDEEWPMPVPIVRTNDIWWFDTDAGDDEILNRRIGKNELNVIEVCRAYVDAQRDYAGQNKDDKNKHEYAQRFMSSDSKHDGLYWPVADGDAESPLGPLIATATAEGYNEKTLGKHEAYHGYYYKILKIQGPHASSGARNYVDKNGHMTKGFALVAFPARYNDSGVMTFIVNHNGIVYQKNLGAKTAAIASRMQQYDPDETWTVVP